MAFLRCVDTDVYYEESGDGESLLFVHGYPQESSIWKPYREALNDRYHTVAIDLPGFGRSQKSTALTYYYWEQVERLRAFVSTKFQAPVTIVSHDYGSLLALGLASRFPSLVKGMMVSNCRAHRTFRWPFYVAFRLLEIVSRSRAARWVLGRSWFGKLHRLMVANDYRTIPRPRVDPSLLTREGVQSLLHFYAKGYKTQLDPAFDEVVRNVRVPTLIVWGEKDLYLDRGIAVEIRERVPGSRLLQYPDGHHYIVDEFPERIIPEIVQLAERASLEGERKDT